MAPSAHAVPSPLRMRLPGLLLLMIVLLTTTLAVDRVGGQPLAPAPEEGPVGSWHIYYQNAAIYLYGSTLNCSTSSGQIATRRRGGQLWCAAALDRNCPGGVNPYGPIARWGCLLNDPRFLYDVYKQTGSNLYYFELRYAPGNCINTYCRDVGTGAHLISYSCWEGSEPDHTFGLEVVGTAPGCAAPYNQVFRLVQPSVHLGNYTGCVTTGPEIIHKQMCNNYVEETQTFMIRPVPKQT